MQRADIVPIQEAAATLTMGTVAAGPHA